MTSDLVALWGALMFAGGACFMWWTTRRQLAEERAANVEALEAIEAAEERSQGHMELVHAVTTAAFPEGWDNKLMSPDRLLGRIRDSTVRYKTAVDVEAKRKLEERAKDRRKRKAQRAARRATR